MDVSIVICTANRAAVLPDTLNSLAMVRTPGSTELLVMDNASVDDTRQVVEQAARTFPFPVRYMFIGTAGKYGALNAGIQNARGGVIAATDDDARFEPDWLERAVNGLSRHRCAFVGGPVRPVWQGPKPSWLDERSAVHSKVIALLDYGDHEREFGRQGISWPLGVNVAYRREVFDQVGLFENRLGRTSGTLRNQAQREWHLRARAAGLRGMYLPGMLVHHLVETERLTRQYFRRWFYWHGVSRAILYRLSGLDIEEPEIQTSGARAGTLGGVPRHLFSKAARSTRSWVWRMLRRQPDAFDYELWLCFFAGVVQQRWTDRRLPVADGLPAPSAALPADATRGQAAAEQV